MCHIPHVDDEIEHKHEVLCQIALRDADVVGSELLRFLNIMLRRGENKDIGVEGFGVDDCVTTLQAWRTSISKL
jgi:hypothetical protein